MLCFSPFSHFIQECIRHHHNASDETEYTQFRNVFEKDQNSCSDRKCKPFTNLTLGNRYLHSDAESYIEEANACMNLILANFFQLHPSIQYTNRSVVKTLHRNNEWISNQYSNYRDHHFTTLNYLITSDNPQLLTTVYISGHVSSSSY